MKKGFIFLLVALAVVVLISPGIVGRLAEKTMDENLDWAATESQEVTVTSQGFDRGWFSSEGQHRIEIHDGELQNFVLALGGSTDISELPALIIDTRLDHGLIPLASLSRDQGTLMPGLGSAISTLGVEPAEGEVVPLPGTIYSEIGLTGELRSKYVLEAGAHDFDGAAVVWGDTTIEIATNPATTGLGFDGSVESVSMAANDEYFSVTGLEFAGKQRNSRFGFSVGDAEISMQAVTVEDYAGASTSLGPVSIGASSSIKSDRVTGRVILKFDNTPFADFGTADIAADIHLIDADAVAVGNISDALEYMQDGGSTDEFMFVVQDDLQRLFAAGAELRFDQLDISLPQGIAKSKMRFVISGSDTDSFTWTSALLDLDASLELSLSAELVTLLTELDPQMHAAIGMGYLKKNGDAYEMEATLKKGLMTINGAPMSIPIPGMQ